MSQKGIGSTKSSDLLMIEEEDREGVFIYPSPFRFVLLRIELGEIRIAICSRKESFWKMGKAGVVGEYINHHKRPRDLRTSKDQAVNLTL